MKLNAFFSILMLASLLVFSPKNRGPANFKSSGESCNSLIKSFKKTKTNFLTKISTKKYELKKKILTSLASAKEKSPKYYYRYSEFLNDSLRQGHLSQDEAQDLIKEFNDMGVKNLFWKEDEKKIYSFYHDSLAGSEDMNLISSKLVGLKSESLLTKSDISEELEELKLTKAEAKEIIKLIKSEPTLEELNDYLLYIRYARGAKKNELQKVLGSITDLNSEKSNKYLNRFRKYRKKTKKYFEKKNDKEFKRISKENPKLDSNEVARLAYKSAFDQSRTYEKLYMSCKAKTTNVDRMTASKKFLMAILAFEAINMTSIYAYTHRDEEVDRKWVQKIIFNLAMGLPWAATRATVVATPSTEMGTKMIIDYILGTFMSIGPSIAIEAQFGTHTKEGKERLRELLESKEGKEIIEFYRDAISKYDLKEDFEHVLNSVGAKDFKELSETDKDLDQRQEELLELIIEEAYINNSGEWKDFRFGSMGMDVYMFNRIWNVNSSIRNIFISLLMYDILCLGQEDPKKALALTFGMYTLNKVINEYFYQDLRFKATGF